MCEPLSIIKHLVIVLRPLMIIIIVKHALMAFVIAKMVSAFTEPVS